MAIRIIKQPAQPSANVIAFPGVLARRRRNRPNVFETTLLRILKDMMADNSPELSSQLTFRRSKMQFGANFCGYFCDE